MPSSSTHILLFPFPDSGHIIPILDIAQKLLIRGFTITVLVTPENLSLLEPFLSTYSSLHTLVLSPPEVRPIPGLVRLIPRLQALSKLYDTITDWFKSHPSPPVAIVSDYFLGWTQNLATDLGVPRVVFWPSGAMAAAIGTFLWRELPKPDDPEDENSMVSLTEVPGCPKFPWWQVGLLQRIFKKEDPNWEFTRDIMLENVKSWGYVFNSFAKIEQVYLDHIKKETGHDRVWAVGPLFPSDNGNIDRGGSSAVQISDLMDWLDTKENDQVVYICFGTRWSLNDKHLGVLASALESSGVHFVWVLKHPDLECFSTDGFEERVKGRGLLIKGWAPQVLILNHRAVGSFVTHCGWNSVLEGLGAGVLLLTWPLGADQFYNVKLLVDELGVAIRFFDDGNRSIPEWTDLTQLLTKSVENSFSETREKVKEMKLAAYEALEGGTSTRDMETCVKELQELGK